MRPVFQPSPEDWPYLRRLGWTILAAAAIVVIWRASNMLLLAFGSVLAVMFGSAARMFQRLGLRNWRAALVLGTLLVLALFGLIAYLLVVQFGSEISAMLGNLPETIASVERRLATTKVGAAIVQATHAAFGGSAIADRLGSVVVGGGEILVNFFIVMVGAMFIAADPRPYRSAIVMLTPPPGRAAMEHALGEVSAALRLWLKAKLLAMVAMTIVISGALWIAGLKSWAALGLLGGLSEFVPYVGPTVAMVPAVGLAAAAGGNVLWHTVVAYLFVRIVEAYALTPGLTRSVVKIPPALTMFVILGVGAVFGIYGVFFAGGAAGRRVRPASRALLAGHFGRGHRRFARRGAGLAQVVCEASHASAEPQLPAGPRTVQPRGPAATSPMCVTSSPASSSSATTSLASSGGTARTMPMPQLKVRAISPGAMLPCRWRNAISPGCSHAPASITACAPSGSTRGIFSSKPPPVMCASASILPPRTTRQQRANVDPRRLHQRVEQAARRN